MDALEPFSRPLRRRWNPPEMSLPPMLDPAAPANLLEPRYALLINPFYPKDPNASFGKHALTPLSPSPASPRPRRNTGRFDTGTKTCSTAGRHSSQCLNWLGSPCI
jgi:hypothetical protein